MATFPPANAGASSVARPSREGSLGGIIPTIPMGSGTEKLKCAVETGFTELWIWAYLSAHPA